MNTYLACDIVVMVCKWYCYKKVNALALDVTNEKFQSVETKDRRFLKEPQIMF